MTNLATPATWLVESLSLIFVLWIVNKKINPAYKLAWTILILAFPVFGDRFSSLFFLNDCFLLSKDEDVEASPSILSLTAFENLFMNSSLGHINMFPSINSKGFDIPFILHNISAYSSV